MIIEIIHFLNIYIFKIHLHNIYIIEIIHFYNIYT